MGLVEDSIVGLADEVTLNPDLVTSNAQMYGQAIIKNRDLIDDMEAVEQMLYEISGYGKWQQRIYLLSLCAYFSCKSKYLLEMISYINNNFDNISLSALLYICNQIGNITFLYPEMLCNDLFTERWKLYDRIMDRYASFFDKELQPIGDSNLNKDFVIVFTEQFLNTLHGPTKSTLDRAKIIIEKMGKQVLIVNTAELNSYIGQIPFCNSLDANYNPELSASDKVEWKGLNIPYFQCDNNMPEISTIYSLLSMVKKIKPSFAISVGGGWSSSIHGF